MKSKFTIEVITCLFILLFVYAAISKLLDYQKFTIQLGQSQMLTNHAGLLAWFIPASELIISFLLILPGTRLIGLYSAFSLMTMFSTYIIFVSQFNNYVPCSCGGVLQNLDWNEHLVFNITFALMGLLAILLYTNVETQIGQLRDIRNG